MFISGGMYNQFYYERVFKVRAANLLQTLGTTLLQDYQVHLKS